MSKLPTNVDGMDQWTVLSTNDALTRRTEIFHNIDPLEQTWALRIQNMKGVFGKKGSTYEWQDWYPMVGEDGIELNCDDEVAPLNMFESELRGVLKHIGRTPQVGKPLVVDCGQRPANESKRCQVTMYLLSVST